MSRFQAMALFYLSLAVIGMIVLEVM